MIFKYGQGHWKWYEQAKLNEQYHHAEFDTDHMCSFWENHKVQVFYHAGQSPGQPNTDHYIDSHFACESKSTP